MALFWKKEEQQFRINIWKTEEDIDALLPQCVLSTGEIQQLNTFQSHYRQKEWLCTRIMLQQMMGLEAMIIYDEFGKPHLKDSSAKISVSHTKDFVGVIASTTHHAGVDLERIHPRIEKIAHKFLSVEEQKRIPSKDKLQYYYVVWGAKEVLFKIYGRGQLLFKEHLLTEPFELSEKGILSGSIKKGDLNKSFQIQYQFIGDLLLTYSIG